MSSENVTLSEKDALNNNNRDSGWAREKVRRTANLPPAVKEYRRTILTEQCTHVEALQNKGREKAYDKRKKLLEQ